MPGTRPNKKELARMKVLADLGEAPTAIANRMNRSHHTIIKYLAEYDFSDPQVKVLIEKIKDRELNDLYLLGAKARNRLHTLLDEGNTKTIETVALMDRAFQQRRLLEGQSTEIHDYEGTSRRIEELKTRLREIERQEAETINVTPGA